MVCAAMSEPMPIDSEGGSVPSGQSKASHGLRHAEHGDKRDQRGDADDDPRDHHRDVDDGVKDRARRATDTLQANGSKRAEDAGQRRRDEGNDQAGFQRVHHEGVLQRAGVPLRGETLELAGVPARVEAEERDDRDRRVEEQVDEHGVDTHRRPPQMIAWSSRLACSRAIRRM